MREKYTHALYPKNKQNSAFIYESILPICGIDRAIASCCLFYDKI